MSQKEYTCSNLYEDAFEVGFEWDRWLPNEVYRFHELQCKETNSPVALQMGTVLPFVSALVGPRTKGRFFSTPSVLNLFWINVAASGTGKSQARHRFVSTPLNYLLENDGKGMIDFEVSNYTIAGMYLVLVSIFCSITVCCNFST